jgi:hypothetical protein
MLSADIRSNCVSAAASDDVLGQGQPPSSRGDRALEENRILKERLDGKRLQFSDAERRRLAQQAYTLGRWCRSRLLVPAPLRFPPRTCVG